MSRKKQIDYEEYKNLYASGMSFNKMAKHFGCGVSTIQNMRLRLSLPIRERVYDRKEIDEIKLELWGEGKTYREIGDELGVTPNSVMRERLSLGLEDRDISLMKLDTEKFKDMYLTGDSYEKIASEFHITDRTVQEIRNKLHLPKRQPTSTYTEKQFIEAHNEGLTYLQLRKKFHISGKVVSMHIKELGWFRCKKFGCFTKPVKNIIIGIFICHKQVNNDTKSKSFSLKRQLNYFCNGTTWII
jgi:hypothetical protein